MKKTSRIISICAAAAMLAPAAFADSQTGAQNGRNNQNEGQQVGTQPTSTMQQAREQQFFRSTAVVGKNAETPQGNKIGDIRDVVFNQKGEIFAMVDVGGGRLAVVPWQALTPAGQGGRQGFVLNASQQSLKAAPTVNRDQWGALNNPQFAQGVYSYYQIQNPATGAASSPGGMSQGQGQSQQGAQQPGQSSQEQQGQQGQQSAQPSQQQQGQQQ